MRQLDDHTLREIFSEETGEVFLALLEIDDLTLSVPIRAVNDTVDHVHLGNTYTAYPFEFVLPPSDGETLPSLTVRISNVSLKLIDLIRRMEAPITIKLKIVLASDINDIKIQVENMELKKVTANEQTIDFSVLSPVFLSSQWPMQTYSKSEYPGLFR